MKERAGLGRWLWSIGLVLATAGAAWGWYRMDRAIPDQVSIVEEEKEEFTFPLPFFTTLSSESKQVVLGNESNIPADEITISGKQTFSMYGEDLGSYQVGLKLFGLIKLKDIQVDVVETRYAIPCGAPIGIYLKSDGILVIGTGKLTGEGGEETEPAQGILKTGDYIEALNGNPVRNKEELMDAVDESQGEEVTLSVRRDGEQIDVQMDPVKTEDGSYKLGAWVRDDTQGIGTVTYVDLNGNFGALGHGISDSDTGGLVQSQEGGIYSAEILGIEKGTLGKPGLLSGVIYYGPSYDRGEIFRNTEDGIFGKVNDSFAQECTLGEAIPVAGRQEVKPGPAKLRSSVSGELKDYEIEIKKVDYNSNHSNKSMVIEITDPELIALTGGIVQGMSGSPIIQDGKLAGAVTHVFLQDAKRGYGILMENMLEAAQ